MRDKLLVCSVALILLFSWSVFASPAAASVAASPASVNFGSVNVNSPSSPATIVLTNNYDRSATIETVSTSLSQFIVTGPSLPLTLQSHHSVSFQVVFDPSTASVISGNVTFTVRRRSTSRRFLRRREPLLQPSRGRSPIISALQIRRFGDSHVARTRRHNQWDHSLFCRFATVTWAFTRDEVQ
jgi:hypothetical protein